MPELEKFGHAETIHEWSPGTRVSVSNDTPFGCVLGCGLVILLFLGLPALAAIDHFSDRLDVSLVGSITTAVIGAIAWRAASSYRLVHPSRGIRFRPPNETCV